MGPSRDGPLGACCLLITPRPPGRYRWRGTGVGGQATGQGGGCFFFWDPAVSGVAELVPLGLELGVSGVEPPRLVGLQRVVVGAGGRAGERSQRGPLAEGALDPLVLAVLQLSPCPRWPPAPFLLLLVLLWDPSALGKGDAHIAAWSHRFWGFSHPCSGAGSGWGALRDPAPCRLRGESSSRAQRESREGAISAKPSLFRRNLRVLAVS